MRKSKIEERLNEKRVNYQGCPMKIVEYNTCNDIIVEFEDEYHLRVHANYYRFTNGNIKNPYYPAILGVGFVGCKYPTGVAPSKHTKEYNTWYKMLERCYGEKYEDTVYGDTTCCSKWLNYENFYEWLHEQENFDKWLNGEHWAIDKDILVKGNKIYSPETCVLIPQKINSLFIKNDIRRGSLPMGVSYHEQSNSYNASLNYNGKVKSRYFKTENEAFVYYKKEKEKNIKQIAKEEFDAGNITEKCYNAMMNYEVEITD